MVQAVAEPEVSDSSAAEPQIPSDDTTATPSAASPEVQDGAPGAVEGTGPVQDGEKPGEVKPEPETDNALWSRYQRSLTGDKEAGSFDAENMARLRTIGQRQTDRQRAADQARAEREAAEKEIGATRAELKADLLELYTPADATDEERELADLRAEKMLGPRWTRVQAAVLKPHKDSIFAGLQALVNQAPDFVTSAVGAKDIGEAIASLNKMDVGQANAALMTMTFLAGQATVPDGFVSKADHEAAIKAVHNEYESQGKKLDAPPKTGKASAAPKSVSYEDIVKIKDPAAMKAIPSDVFMKAISGE